MPAVDRRPTPRHPALTPLACLLTGLLAGLGPVLAQTATPAAVTPPPDGPPPAVRYTPLVADGPLLYPRAPGQDAEPGALLRVEAEGRPGLAYAANAAVGRLLVAVDRDAVPADGQSGVKLKVQVLGRDGQPLRQTAYLTIEHSGGRLLLPGARSDEFGPRALDADRATPGVQLKVDGGSAEFTLLAPDQAMDVRLRVSAGSQQAAGTISFVPERRPMLAAGLVEGTINLRNGGVQPVQRGDVFEREIRQWSRRFDGDKAEVGARAAFN